MGTKNNNCPFHDIVIHKYILDDISPADDIRLQEHVLGCALCQHDIELILHNERVLSRESLPVLSVDFKKKLMKRIQERDVHDARKKVLYTIGFRAAAALVFIFMTSVLMIGMLIKSVSKPSVSTEIIDMDFKKTKGGEKIDVDRLISGTVKEFLTENGIERHRVSVHVRESRADDVPYKAYMKEGSYPESKEDAIIGKISKKSRVMVKNKDLLAGRKTAEIIIESTPWGIYHLKKHVGTLEKDLFEKYIYNIKLVLSADMPFKVFEGWNLIIFLVIILMEIIVRIALVYNIRKYRVYRNFSYPASIFLGSLFVPLYLILLHRRLKQIS